MAKIIRTKTGKTFKFLMPHEKGEKYANELKNGWSITNDGEMKKDADGTAMMLSDEQRAYRSGYLDARKDEAKLFKWKQKKSK